MPFYRSAEASSDMATTWAVLVEVAKRYEEMGYNFDYVMSLYPCAPFVTPKRIREAMNKLVESGADALQNIVRYSCPPQRGLVIRNGSVEYMYPEYMDWRSQDLEPVYHDCGQSYFVKYGILTGKVERTGITVPIIVPEEIVQDVDNWSDWNLAEIKYRKFILAEKL